MPSLDYRQSSYPLMFGALGLVLLLGVATPGQALLLGPHSLADAAAEFVGGRKTDLLGWSVAGVGDVNGDGFDDVLLGAPGGSSAEEGGLDGGAAYLFYGPQVGEHDPADADVAFQGEAGHPTLGGRTGWSVAAAGDVNADGSADLLIGAPRNSESGLVAGKAYLVYGRADLPGRYALAESDATFVGEASPDYVGQSVASAGDVDGDGFGDVLIAAPFSDEQGFWTGKVFLYYGPIYGAHNVSDADARIEAEAGWGLTGWSVAGAGDINRDGHDDLLIGAPLLADGGAAYLFYGPLHGTTNANRADVKFVQDPHLGGGVGAVVKGLGDVNADGWDDFAIGAPNSLYRGAVYVFFGGPLFALRASQLRPLLVEAADVQIVAEGLCPLPFCSNDFGEPRAGDFVAGPGDVNGDGYNDLVIGAPFNDGVAPDAGVAYLLLGGPVWPPVLPLTAAAATWSGEHEGDQAGFSVGGAGDVDGDGLRDLIIGAPWYDEDDAPYAGAAYLVHGEPLLPG